MNVDEKVMLLAVGDLGVTEVLRHEEERDARALRLDRRLSARARFRNANTVKIRGRRA
jgi:hypothetical protein